MAFSNGGRVEDVTERYTQDFGAVKQRRKKNKSSMLLLTTCTILDMSVYHSLFEHIRFVDIFFQQYIPLAHALI